LTTTQPQQRVLAEGQQAMHALRRALAGVVSALGADGLQSQSLSRRFGIDKTLAWRLTRAMREEDPWEALQFLPTRAGIDIFSQAMARAGAPEPALKQLSDAFDEFEQFVQDHARDRDTLEMIVSVPEGRSTEKKLLALRKGGFQCNSSLLGVRASLHFGLNIVAPSRIHADHLDIASISGLVELFRLRPSVSWPVATVKNWGGAAGDLIDPARGVVPISPGEQDPDSPLMREFCSPRDLRLRVAEQPRGTFRYLMERGPVGYSASATIVTGRLHIATASSRQSFAGEAGEHGVNLCTPVEEVVCDLLVHKDLAFAMDVSARTYSQFPGRPVYPDPDAENLTLPVPNKVLDLGQTPPDPPSRATPWYPEMIARTATRMGHAADDFRAFRYRLQYPPIPSLVVLRHPLLRA
jgi:hypothetical protein